MREQKVGRITFGQRLGLDFSEGGLMMDVLLEAYLGKLIFLLSW
jgi:hypothetical protein